MPSNVTHIDSTRTPKESRGAAEGLAGLRSFHHHAAKEDGKGPQVLLLSLRAGRDGPSGLTLTAATVVYLLDPSPNWGVEDQAVARIHRIGQTQPTTVLHVYHACLCLCNREERPFLHRATITLRGSGGAYLR